MDVVNLLKKKYKALMPTASGLFLDYFPPYFILYASVLQ